MRRFFVKFVIALCVIGLSFWAAYGLGIISFQESASKRVFGFMLHGIIVIVSFATLVINVRRSKSKPALLVAIVYMLLIALISSVPIYYHFYDWGWHVLSWQMLATALTLPWNFLLLPASPVTCANIFLETGILMVYATLNMTIIYLILASLGRVNIRVDESQQPQPNNSFNASGNSAALIRED